MLRYTICLALVLSQVLTRHVPRFAELDAEEQQLYRAAYDTPSYDHDEYEEDLEPGKLDLLKDGLWAIKAKIKELKAFDKALAANVLMTKLKLKELLEYHLKKKPIELVVEKKKPSYSYSQSPAHPAQPHYEPQYAAPASAPSYHQEPQYTAPAPAYHQEPQYAAPAPSYHQEPQYAAPAPAYHQEPQYAAPASAYHHDPYYGH